MKEAEQIVTTIAVEDYARPNASPSLEKRGIECCHKGFAGWARQSI